MQTGPRTLGYQCGGVLSPSLGTAFLFPTSSMNPTTPTCQEQLQAASFSTPTFQTRVILLPESHLIHTWGRWHFQTSPQVQTECGSEHRDWMSLV